jgi:predicted O-linked N-acetylglucosamine transferase (SPINDLY family)
VFQQWMALLRAVPDSVLWLLAGHGTARENLAREAAQAGIDPRRLVFAPTAPQAEHLARLALADVALDTFPFCSHTTASDALWASVPLITCVGRSYASRVAASCLSAVGLPELITTSADAYLKLATALATDAPRRTALRHHLQAARPHCPLFDTAATVRALETAYEAMWLRQLEGLPPVGLDIQP